METQKIIDSFRHEWLPDAEQFQNALEKIEWLNVLIDENIKPEGQYVLEIMELSIELWNDFVLPFDRYAMELESLLDIEHVTPEERFKTWLEDNILNF